MIGILTRVIPLSVDKVRESVDTVHRLGKKNNAATNKMPVIIQFALRTVRDEVWRRSREARVCRDMNIQFKRTSQKKIVRLVLSCGPRCKKPEEKSPP